MSKSISEATVPTFIVAAMPQRDLRPHYLEESIEDGAIQRLPLDRPTIVLGRAEDATIRIESQRASRKHASIVRRGPEYVLQDHDSRNGVYLNGLRVHSAILREGDILQIADRVYTYREG